MEVMFKPTFSISLGVFLVASGFWAPVITRCRLELVPDFGILCEIIFVWSKAERSPISIPSTRRLISHQTFFLFRPIMFPTLSPSKEWDFHISLNFWLGVSSFVSSARTVIWLGVEFFSRPSRTVWITD